MGFLCVVSTGYDCICRYVLDDTGKEYSFI